MFARNYRNTVFIVCLQETIETEFSDKEPNYINVKR